MGIYFKIISGYVKGVDYIFGMKFNLDIDKYFWNVVYINGIWGLVDVDWVVRGIIKKFRKFYYWLDEYYFFFDFYYFICVYFFNDK